MCVCVLCACVCVCARVCVVCVCACVCVVVLGGGGIFYIIITPLHVQAHGVLGGSISIAGGWMLFRKELILAEDSPQINAALTF